MADIFISYARSTEQQAQAVGAALRALGYSVWRDDDLPSHRNYGDVIEEQIDQAKAVLVIWSPDAVRSQWVRSEADRARARERLVQLAVDEVHLPMPFDQIQCADLRDWSGETDHPGWTKTLASISALARGGGLVLPPSGLIAILAAELEGIDLLRLNHRAAIDGALATTAAGFLADVEARGGTVFRQADRVMMAAFPVPEAAAAAAIQAQSSLSGQSWPGVGELKVRMAAHFGAVGARDSDLFGPAVNRVSKLLTLAQGGQVLLTATLAEMLPDGFRLKPLGAHALEDPLTKVNLLQLSAEGLKEDFAPIAHELVQIGNLPRRQGALIGRDQDLTQIGDLFEDANLVTITGTGGVGKTRIAIEYALGRQGAHEDGVWLVELAPAVDPEQVTGAIAGALGLVLPPGGDPVQALVERLRPRDCLIVLDNCEHVIDAVAAVAEAVLSLAPRVRLLASSQELIGVEGERVFRLRSLGEPDAVALFTARAKAVDAGFAVKGRDAAAVAAICRRLDGIPLAIEMAAARAPTLGCEALLKHLDDRFRILTGGRRTALPRQRTLAAALDWSHGLLSTEDATVFRRLGVFTGGFTMEAASGVAADDTLDGLDVIDALSNLVAKSLVVAETQDNRTRYRLLETTRMYALERMAEAGESLAVQRRHAEVLCDFVQPSDADYYTLTDEAFHVRYAADLDNLERALDWAFGPDGDTEIALALTSYSWSVFASFSNSYAYITWCDLAVARITVETPEVLALRVRSTATSVNMLARVAPAPAMADEILPALRARNDLALGETLVAQATALLWMGRVDEARAPANELAALIAQSPPSRLTAGGARVAALLAVESGDMAAAVQHFDAGVKMAEAIGASGWACILARERVIADRSMPADKAVAMLRDLLARIRPEHMFRADNQLLATHALVQRLAHRQCPGDVEEAYALARSTEKLFGRQLVAFTTQVVVSLAIADGRPRDAARLHGFAEARRTEYGVNTSDAVAVAEENRAALREYLSEAELESLMAEGARLTPEQNFLLAMKLDV